MPLIDQGLTLQLDVVANDKSTTGFFSKFKQQTKEMVNVWNQSWKEMGQTVNNEVKEIKVQVRSMGTVTKNEVRNIMKTSSASFKSVKNNASSAFVGIRKEARTTSTTINTEMGKAKKSSTDAYRKIGRESENAGKKSKKAFTGMRSKLQDILSITNFVSRGLNTISRSLDGIISTSIGQFAPFEASLDELQVLANASDETMGRMERRFQSVGRTSRFTTQQMTDFSIGLKRSGEELTDISSKLNAFDDFAEANRISIGKSGDIIRASLKSMGRGFEDAELFMDNFTATAKASNTTAAQLGRGFIKIGGLARELEVPLESLTRELGVLANRQLTGMKGSRQLFNIMTRLLDPTAKVSRATKELGFNFKHELGKAGGDLRQVFNALQERMSHFTKEQQVTFKTTIAGKRNFEALAAVLSATDSEIAKITLSQLNQTGATKKQAEAMRDNLQFAVISLQSSISNLQSNMGKSFAPTIRLLAESLQVVVDLFTMLPKPIKDIVAFFVLGAAAGSKLASTFGLVAVGAAATVVQLNIMAAVMGLELPAALALLQGSLATTFATMKAGMASIAVAAAPFIALAGTIFLAYKTNFGGLKEVMDDFFSFLKEEFTHANSWLNQFYRGVETGSKKSKGWLESLGDSFKEVFGGISKTVEHVVNLLKRFSGTLGALAVGDWRQAIKEFTGESEFEEQIEANDKIIAQNTELTEQLKGLTQAQKKKLIESKRAKKAAEEEADSLRGLSDEIALVRKEIEETTDAKVRKEKVSELKILQEKKDALEIESGLKEKAETKSAKSKKKHIKATEKAELKSFKERFNAFKNMEEKKREQLKQTALLSKKTSQQTSISGSSNVGGGVGATPGQRIASRAQQFVKSGEAFSFAAQATTKQLVKLGGSCAATVKQMLDLSGETEDLGAVIGNANWVPNWLKLVEKGYAKVVSTTAARAGDIILKRSKGHIGLVTGKGTQIDAASSAGRRRGVGQLAIERGFGAQGSNPIILRLLSKAFKKGAAAGAGGMSTGGSTSGAGSMAAIDKAGIHERIAFLKKELSKATTEGTRKEILKQIEMLEKQSAKASTKIAKDQVKKAEELAKKKAAIQKKLKEEIKRIEESSDAEIAELNDDTLQHKLGLLDKEKDATAKSTKEKLLAEKLYNAKLKKLAINTLKERLKLLDTLQTEIAGINKTTEEQQLKETKKMIAKIEKEITLFDKKIANRKVKVEPKKDKPVIPGAPTAALGEGIKESTEELDKQVKKVEEVKTAYSHLNSEQKKELGTLGRLVTEEEKKDKILSGQVNTLEDVEKTIKKSNKAQQTSIFFAKQTLKVDGAILTLLKEKQSRLEKIIPIIKEMHGIEKDMVVLNSANNQLDDMVERREVNSLEAAQLRAKIKTEELRLQRLSNQAEFKRAIIEGKSIEQMQEIIAHAETSLGIKRDIRREEEKTYENQLKRLGLEFQRGDIKALDLVKERLRLTGEEIENRKKADSVGRRPDQDEANQERINQLTQERLGLSSLLAVSEGQFNKELFQSLGVSDKLSVSFANIGNQVVKLAEKIPGLKEALASVSEELIEGAKGVSAVLSGDLIGGGFQMGVSAMKSMGRVITELLQSLSGETDKILQEAQQKRMAELDSQLNEINSRITNANISLRKELGTITESEAISLKLKIETQEIDSDIDKLKDEITTKFQSTGKDGLFDQFLGTMKNIRFDDATIKDMFEKVGRGESVQLYGSPEQKKKAMTELTKLYELIQKKNNAVSLADKKRHEEALKEVKIEEDAKREAAQREEELNKKAAEKTQARYEQFNSLREEEADRRIGLMSDVTDKELDQIDIAHKRRLENIEKEFDAYGEGWEKNSLIQAATELANLKRQDKINEALKKKQERLKKEKLSDISDEKKALIDRANLLKSVQDEQFKADRLRHDAEITRLEASLLPLKREREELQKQIKDLENQRKVDLADIDKGALENFKELVAGFTIPEELKQDALNRFGFNVEAGDLPSSTAELETMKDAMEEFFQTRKTELDAKQDIEEISESDYDAQLRQLHLIRGKFYDKIRKDDKLNFKDRLHGLTSFRDAFIDFETAQKNAIEDKYLAEKKLIEDSLMANDNKQQVILSDIEKEKIAIEDLEIAYKAKLTQINTEINKINKAHVDWEANIKGVGKTFKAEMEGMIADANSFKNILSSFSSDTPTIENGFVTNDSGQANEGTYVLTEGSESGYQTHRVIKNGNEVAMFDSVAEFNPTNNVPLSKRSGSMRWFNESAVSNPYYSQLQDLPGFSKGGIKGDDGPAFIRRDEIIIPPDLSRFITDTFKSYNSPAAANNKTMTNEINLGGIHLNSPVVKSEADVMKIMEYMMQEVMPEFSRQLSDKIGNVISPEF